MITDIFCCTYAKDARWLEYMLRSCQKHAHGFRQVVVVFPDKDREPLQAICESFPFVKAFEFRENGDGHAFQNEIKSCCDEYSDADYFLLMDSDCAFIADVTPGQFLTDGLFDVNYLHYDEPGAVWEGGRLPWKEITDAALGVDCMYETMQQFPFIFPRWLFADLRAHIERLHGKSFHEYVHTARPLGRAWHGYSEFCALGGFALYFHRGKMFGNNVVAPHDKPKVVKQFWSHSGLTDPERVELEQITAGWESAEWPK